MPSPNTITDIKLSGVENQIGFLTTSFSHLARSYLLRRLQEQGRDAGLKMDELPIIARLMEQPGLPQAELNRLTFKDKATVTRLLAALEKKGLIIRRVDEHDRRARKISLSPRGEQLVNDFIPVAQQMHETLFQGLSEQDIAITQRTMKLLYQRIAEQTELSGKS